MQISYLLGRNSKFKTERHRAFMTSQTNYKRKKGHEKTLLTSIAALSLLLVAGLLRILFMPNKKWFITSIILTSNDPSEQ